MEDVVTQLMQVAKDLLAKDHREHFEQGHYFNLIEIAGLVYDENFHSDFIATLLDPRGEHGQGVTFLRCFFEFAGCVGRTDISLEHNRFRLIIENKIDACDQSAQIARYVQCANDRKLDWALLYLSIHGSKPADQSMVGMSDDDRQKVFFISYSEFIHDWIDRCLKQVAAIPPIREVLAMYAQTISCLAGSSPDIKAAIEMCGYINNSDDLRAAEKIHLAYLQKKDQIFLDFVESLRESATAKIKKTIQQFDPESDVFKSDHHYGYEFRLPLSGIYSDIDFRICMLIDKSLYFGFRQRRDKEKIENWYKDTALQNIREAVKSLASPPITANLVPWKDFPGWIKPSRTLDFCTFDEECMKLIDTKEFDSCVESLASEFQAIATEILRAAVPN